MESSALEMNVTEVLPSGFRRLKDEEIKLIEIFLVRCQKALEELECSEICAGRLLWLTVVQIFVSLLRPLPSLHHQTYYIQPLQLTG